MTSFAFFLVEVFCFAMELRAIRRDDPLGVVAWFAALLAAWFFVMAA